MTKATYNLLPETNAAIEAFNQMLAQKRQERWGTRPEASFTAVEYCQRHRISRSAAYFELEAAVTRGFAQKTFLLIQGKRTAIYAIVASRAFEAFRRTKTQARPEGAFTIAEYARRHGISRNAAKGRLATVLEQGRVQKSFVLLPSDSGSNWTAVFTKKR